MEFCLVAEDEDTLMGFALGTTITKNHSAWKYGYLIWLGVCREYQRNKVAKKLFNRFKDLILAPESRNIQLALVGHLDTVTAYDLENFAGREKGDEIQGLGAADMKGGCAAMIEAYLALSGRTASPLPVALCLVVGEEETGDGAVQLMKEFRFSWAVIGEPTGLVPCFKSYGYIESMISAKGKRIHACCRICRARIYRSLD